MMTRFPIRKRKLAYIDSSNNSVLEFYLLNYSKDSKICERNCTFGWGTPTAEAFSESLINRVERTLRFQYEKYEEGKVDVKNSRIFEF